MKYGEGKGYYDNVDELSLGIMLHGFNYPDETGEDKLQVRFWKPKMKKGIIHFYRPEKCEMVRDIREVRTKQFNADNVIFAEEEEKQLEGGRL